MAFSAVIVLAAMGVTLLYLGMTARSSSPLVSTNTPVPTTTPTPFVDRFGTVVSLLENLQPTPTETERPETTRLPTHTPIPLCGVAPPGVTCDNWTPTPTESPLPTWTPSPTIAPCPANPLAGVSPPRYCISQETEQ
jgi:hypothetical protein